MKKLMFALACAASAAVMGADTLNNKATFEAFDAGTTAAALADKTDANETTGTKFWQFGTTGSANDASVVANETPHADGGSKYLQLETNGDELQRKVNAESVGNGLYIDTLVQFTATPKAPTIDAGAKLAIWLEGEDTYTLKVAGAQIGLAEDGNFKCTKATYTVAGTFAPDTWYRLTVKAVPSVIVEDLGYLPGFTITIDKTEYAVVEDVCAEGVVDALAAVEAQGTTVWASGMKALVTGKKFVPSASIVNGMNELTLTSVGFQGSGAIDNVTITDEDPLVDNTTVSFTIDLGDNVTAVSYTIGTADAVTINADKTFDVALGATVTVTAATAADWYTVAIPAAVKASAENNSIAVTATKVEVTDGALPEGTTAADLGIKTGAFASADTAALAPVVKWAQANNISVSAINAMAFTSGDLTYNEKGYLFNMDPTDTDAIDDEEEGFKVTAISYNAETGKWEVEDNGKNTWNGKVEIRGAESLTNPDWSKDNEAGPFFKAFLTK